VISLLSSSLKILSPPFFGKFKTVRR